MIGIHNADNDVKQNMIHYYYENNVWQEILKDIDVKNELQECEKYFKVFSFCKIGKYSGMVETNADTMSQTGRF